MSPGGNVGPGEAEEGLLGLEIADLQQAPDLFRQPLAPVDQSAFGGAQGEELGPLEVVEVGKAVQREPFGLGEDGQPLAAVGAHRSVGHAVVSIGWTGLGLSL
jgi:hypothetical protein